MNPKNVVCHLSSDPCPQTTGLRGTGAMPGGGVTGVGALPRGATWSVYACGVPARGCWCSSANVGPLAIFGLISYRGVIICYTTLHCWRHCGVLPWGQGCMGRDAAPCEDIRKLYHISSLYEWYNQKTGECNALGD